MYRLLINHGDDFFADPHFVGSFDVGDYVYFFFRELAVENLNCERIVFSRVARICKVITRWIYSIAAESDILWQWKQSMEASRSNGGSFLNAFEIQMPCRCLSNSRNWSTEWIHVSDWKEPRLPQFLNMYRVQLNSVLSSALNDQVVPLFSPK